MIYAYLRYSSENQRDGVSIETQRAAVKSLVSTRPEIRSQTIIERIDEARSATTLRKREALAQIRREVRTGDVVVVYKLDRLARDLYEALKVLKDFEARGVKLLSTCEPEMPLVQHVLLAMSEEFSRQLSDRCKNALDTCARYGFAANKPPFGYRIIRLGERAKFELVPEHAEIVKRIFELRASGLSARSIVSIFNNEGLTSPRGKLWRASTINAMLRCETYRGTIISGYRKFKKGHGLVAKRPRSEWTVTQNAHPAIIDDELWDRVRSGDRLGVVRQKTTPRGPAKYLLSGFLRCKHCGANLIVETCKTGKYYGCSSGRETAKKLDCNHRFLVRVDVAERLITKALIDLVYGNDFVEEVVAIFRKEVERARGEMGQVLPDLEADLCRLDNQIESAARRLTVVPEDSMTVFLDELRRLKAQRDSLRQRIEATRNAVGKTSSAEELERQLRSRIKNFESEINTTDVAKARSLLAEAVNKIEVSSTKEATIFPKVASDIHLVLGYIPTGICSFPCGGTFAFVMPRCNSITKRTSSMVRF
jgi:site-specific DNA recombinase